MKIKGKVFLAPMAGVTVMPFRVLCRKYGADYVCTEMINAIALSRRNKATLKMLEHCEEERPVGAQLFGANTESIIKSAKMIKDDFDFIDFNLGCPSISVMKSGAGAALLKRKNKIEEIVSKLVKIGKPVMVKIRIGPDARHINAVEICKMLDELGLSAITIHGRNAKQGYRDEADWEIIQQVKREVKTPIIGNGDIFSRKDAVKRLKISDGIMIGRGAIGNPGIFREIKNGKEYNNTEKIDDFLSIAEQLDDKSIKIQANYFTKGIAKSRIFREKINSGDRKEIIMLMKKLKKELQVGS